jgi:hypothetical protein
VASGAVLYRRSSGSGAPEAQTLAALKSDLALTGTNAGDQVLGALADSVATTVAGLKADFNALLAAMRAPSVGTPMLTPAGTPVIALSTTTVSHAEGDSGSTAYVFTVTRGSGDITGTSSASWAVTGSGGSPASASDFLGGVLPSGSVSFGPGVTSQDITVNVVGDASVETDETFTLTLSAPVNATLGTATATGTITNDDTLPVVAMTTTTLSQAEGNSGLTNFLFNVGRSGNLAASSAVNWAVTGSGGNPANAADFAGGVLPSGTLNYASGDTTQTITVQVAGDVTVETDETFTVTLSSPTGATLGTATAVGTITNEDVSGTARAAPTLGYPTPQTTNPATVTIKLPADWISGDVLKLDRSASSSMSSPTTLSHTLTDADAAAGTVSIGLSGVTLSGVTYFQAYETGSANKSNIVAWGDAVAPTITTSSTQSVTETLALAVTLAATDAGAGVPAVASDGTTPGWFISGGADQLQFEISGTTLRWLNNATQATGSPADQGVNNVYDVIIGAIDYSGNLTAKAIAVTVNAADLSPTAFSLGDQSGAALSTVYTSTAIQVLDVTSGVNVPGSVTGGEYRIDPTGTGSSYGDWTAAGSFATHLNELIQVRGTASGSYSTNVDVVLSIGSGPAVTDTFTIQTIANPSSVPWTVGSVYTGSTAGTTITVNNVNFPATGTGILRVRAGQLVSGVTVGGVACTQVGSATTTGPKASMWRVPIAASGNKTVVLTVFGATSLSFDVGVLNTTDPVPAATAFRDWGFRSDPQTTGTTLTCPTNGIIISLGVANGTTPTWQAPATAENSDSGQQFGTSSSRANDDPSFTGGNGGAIIAASWNP